MRRARFRRPLLLLPILSSIFFAPLAGWAEPGNAYARSVVRYDVPDVTLTDMDGRPVRLRSALGGSGPIVLDFMYATCSGICPILSALLARAQEELGDQARDIAILSISIDPEADTPERLKLYAQGFDAKPNWRFLTGSLEDVVAVERSFDAYRGNKMRHEPLIFLHPGAGGVEWVRLNGSIGAAELAAEMRRLARH